MENSNNNDHDVKRSYSPSSYIKEREFLEFKLEVSKELASLESAIQKSAEATERNTDVLKRIGFVVLVAVIMSVLKSTGIII